MSPIKIFRGNKRIRPKVSYSESFFFKVFNETFFFFINTILSPKNIASSYKKFLYSYVYAMLQNNNNNKKLC